MVLLRSLQQLQRDKAVGNKVWQVDLERHAVGVKESELIAAAQLAVQGCAWKMRTNVFARIKGAAALGPIHAIAAGRPLNVEEGLYKDIGSMWGLGM